MIYDYNHVLSEVKRMIWPSQNQFARRIGLSQQYLSAMVKGDSPISPKFLKLLGYKKVKANQYLKTGGL